MLSLGEVERLEYRYFVQFLKLICESIIIFKNLKKYSSQRLFPEILIQ